jgi:hypothetical protein
MAAASRAGAAVLSSGHILATAETARKKDTTKVLLFSSTGSSVSTPLTINGYIEPTIATNGTRAWIVMVRTSDGFVVSREFNGSTWTSVDRVEIGSEGGGSHRWPNLLREVTNQMVFTVAGPGTASSKKVWGYRRAT